MDHTLPRRPNDANQTGPKRARVTRQGPWESQTAAERCGILPQSRDRARKQGRLRAS